MKERPILFSAPMIRAILDGRKTMTRRIVKDPMDKNGGQYCVEHADDDPNFLVHVHNPKCEGYCDYACHYPCPFGQPGTKLYVRETWAEGWTYGGSNRVVFYRATNDGYIGSETYPVQDVQNGKFGLTACGADASAPEDLKWRPSIHMPRWASRLTLLVKAVRVERLQEITGKDAAAEGMELLRWKTGIYPAQDPGMEIDDMMLVNEFRSLWQSLNAKRPGCSWEDNPWCWVVEFEQVKGGGE